MTADSGNFVSCLIFHAACSSPYRIGGMPLLDRREVSIFVILDSGSGGLIFSSLGIWSGSFGEYILRR
jgi:hypothetical protein